MRKYTYNICDTELGSSTLCEVITNSKGLVTKINNTSILDINYEWYHWKIDLNELKGKPFNEVDSIIKSTLNEYKDEFPHLYIEMIEDKNIFICNLSEQAEAWKEDGYEEFGKALEEHIQYCSHVCWNENINYEIKRMPIISTVSKQLEGRVTLNNKDVSPIRIDSLSITNKLTGEKLPLNTNDIEIKQLSGSQMKDLLSGNKVSGIAGISGYLDLNNTPAGWVLSTSKSISNLVDSESEL